MSIIVANRSIGALQIDAVISENHESLMVITDNPVEQGSNVNDHAYVEPKRVTLDIANNNAADSYTDLLRIQASRQPLTIVTGLVVYTNMLIESINATRDKRTSRILSAQVSFKEVIIVGTQSVQATINTQTESIGESNIPATQDRIQRVLERGDTAVTLVPREEAEAVLNDLLAQN